MKYALVMVQRCVNPACREPFRYFRSGKIYRFDPRDAVCPRIAQDQQQRVEHFWLCARCSAKLSLVRLPNGAVAIMETCPRLRDEQSEQPCAFPVKARLEPVASAQPHQNKDRGVRKSRRRPGDRRLRILILDVEMKTLGFIEQMLQDSGLDAIPSTSVVETNSLLKTRFFDIFVEIERPVRSQSAKTVALHDARVHCGSYFCWSAKNVKQQCIDFVEEAVKWQVRERPKAS